jgi:hypothetical protein
VANGAFVGAFVGVGATVAVGSPVAVGSSVAVGSASTVGVTDAVGSICVAADSSKRNEAPACVPKSLVATTTSNRPDSISSPSGQREGMLNDKR